MSQDLLNESCPAGGGGGKGESGVASESQDIFALFAGIGGARR